jgi:predicted Zn-dependent peptidase
MVRDEKIAVSVTAQMQPFHRVGMMEVTATAKPGVDPALVERRLNEIIAEFIANGPTEDEVRRAATQDVAGRIRGLEQVGGFGGKAVALAEGQVYAGDSDFYKKTLQRYATTTPAEIRTAMQQWLSRPAFTVRLEPGERPPYIEAKGTKRAKTADVPTKKTPRVIPPIAQTPPLDFPEIQHVRLSNGMEVHYAQRNAVPVTQIALAFDAGFSADAPNARGVQNLALSLLDEGADGMTSQQIAEEQERLGAVIGAGGTADRSTVSLSALSANIGPSLDLLADVVQRPDYVPAEVERIRAQTLTAISQAQKEPNAIATRALPPLLYGASHPYATTALGDVRAVEAARREDLVAFQQSWLRPDNGEIFVVSSLPLAELLPQLEARFGTWTAPGAPKGVKAFSAPPARPAKPRIVLIDRPGSPQSVILAGQVTPVDPMSDIVPISGASEVFGGNFLSRINMDLRETKGWSYGVRGTVGLHVHAVPYTISAPVQADRTGDSIRALNSQLSDILGRKGITQEELTRLVSNNVDALPGRFETSAAVLQAMITNDLYKRPDDYYEQLAGKYRGLTQAQLDAALKQAVDPRGFVWVVVGDAKTVRPQLARLGMPIEVIEAR